MLTGTGRERGGGEREGDYYFKYWELGIEMFDLIWKKFDF